MAPTDDTALPDTATREWLDAQYDARGQVDDADAIIAAWYEESRAIRAEFPPVEVRYGDHPRQAVDVFRAADAPRPARLVVFVHGGYWQALDKETFGFPALGLVGR